MTAFVLVHGAFVDGRCWSDVARILEKDGHRAEVVERLPSCGPGPGDLKADALEVRRVVEAVGEPVVLVGHGYGGMPVTELADHPGVARTVYVAGFWPAPGRSALDLLAAGSPMTWASPRGDGTVVASDDLELLRQTLCGDVPPERALPELRRMHAQTLASFAGASSGPVRTHPVTYVVCQRDYALDPGLQEQMARSADDVRHLPSSHLVMASMPDRLAAVLAGFVLSRGVSVRT